MGTTYFIQPIAPVEANTVLIPAGSVTFGLERRELNPSIVAAFYEGRPDVGAVQEAIEKTGDLVDSGVSIHVFGAEDGLEYLRFDCFDNGPHYHYVHPREEWQVVNEIDPVASGDPFDWAVDRLGHRLPEMLRQAGGAEFADHLDSEAIGAALEHLVEINARASSGRGGHD